MHPNCDNWGRGNPLPYPLQTTQMQQRLLPFHHHTWHVTASGKNPHKHIYLSPDKWHFNDRQKQLSRDILNVKWSVRIHCTFVMDDVSMDLLKMEMDNDCTSFYCTVAYALFIISVPLQYSSSSFLFLAPEK